MFDADFTHVKLQSKGFKYHEILTFPKAKIVRALEQRTNSNLERDKAMNSFVAQSKVSVFSLFIVLFFLLGSNLQATPGTKSTENSNVKSSVKDIQLSPKEKAWLQDKHIVRVPCW